MTAKLVDISLDVHAGEVFGFLWPNNAGKSTTIRTLLDQIGSSSPRIVARIDF